MLLLLSLQRRGGEKPVLTGESENAKAVEVMVCGLLARLALLSAVWSAALTPPPQHLPPHPPNPPAPPGQGAAEGTVLARQLLLVGS